MMFAKPVALNSQAHRDLLFQPAGAYGFAAKLHAAPLCAAEFFAAAKEYAIVFVRHGEADALPVIVLGVNPEQNSFVSADGQWHARYVPLVVRSYPFAAVQGTDAGSVQVVIDESYPGFDSIAGIPLFGEGGEPGPELKRQLEFLRAYQRDIGRTRLFAAELVRLGLLTERGAQLQAGGGPRFELKGFWAVDQARLDALPDADLLALTRQGYFSLITAHLLSISNLGLLAPKQPAPTAVAPTPVTPTAVTPTGEAETLRHPSSKKSKARVHAKD